MSNRSALLQDVLADREAEALLLLVTDEREVGVEEIVRGVSLARVRELNDIDQHVGERIAGHCAVGSPLHLEVEKEAAVAGEDGDGTERAVTLKLAQLGDLFEAGPVFVLEDDAGWIVVDDALDDLRRHDDAEQQRIILDDKGDVRADRSEERRVGKEWRY